MAEDRSKALVRPFRSFRGQILLAMGGLVAAMIIIGVLVNVTLTRRALQEQIVFSLRRFATLEAGSLGDGFRRSREILGLEAKSPALAAADSAQVAAQLDLDRRILPSFDSIYLLRAGRIFAYSGERPGPQVSRTVLSDLPRLLVTPLLVREGGTFDYLMAAPVIGPDSSAYLIGRLCLPCFLRRNGGVDFSGGPAIILLDRDRRILAGVGMKTAMVGRLAQPMLGAAMAGLPPGRVLISTHYSRALLTRVITAVVAVPGTPFFLSTPRPADIALAPVARSRELLLLFAGFGLGLALLLSLILSGVLSRRLRIMEGVAKRIEDGETSLRFPEDGPLEFGLLARSANRAFAAIDQERQSQLQLKWAYAALSEGRDPVELLDQVGTVVQSIAGGPVLTLLSPELDSQPACRLFLPEGQRRNVHCVERAGCPSLTAILHRPVRELAMAQPLEWPEGCREELSLAGREAVIFPLIYRDETYGLIVVGRRPGQCREGAWELIEELARTTAISLHNVRTYRRLEEALTEVQRGKETLLKTLAQTLEIREHETANHSERVAANAVTLARAMGLEDGEFIYNLYLGAYLHDLGKIGIPDRILLKPGPLTAEEWANMRRHPVIGADILGEVPFLSEAREIVLAHQERWDGSGYPRGLRGEAIPIGARIFAVVDALDAMTSDRPYRPALSYGQAKREIELEAGHQFDPAVIRAFRQVPLEHWLLAHREAGSGGYLTEA